MKRELSDRSIISAKGSWRSPRLVNDDFVRAMTFGELAEGDRPSNEQVMIGTEISILAPENRHVLRSSLKSIVMISIGLTIMFVLMILLFLGASWQPKNYYGGIQLAFLDLDRGEVGAALLSKVNSSAMPFSWTIIPSNTLLDDLKSEVDQGLWNVALVVNPGSTSALIAAITSSTSTYDPANATSYIFDQGRSGSSMATIIRTTLSAVVEGASSNFASTLIRTLTAAPLSTLNSKILVSPIGYTEINLHPVEFTGEYVATDFGARLPPLF